MADPLSIVSSISALLQLTRAVVHFLSDISGTSESRQNILNEVSSLSDLLVILIEVTKRSHQSHTWSTTRKSLSHLDGPLVQCQKEMERLKSKLKRTKFGEVLTWPFENDEINKILKAIERQKTSFVLSLQTDHL